MRKLFALVLFVVAMTLAVSFTALNMTPVVLNLEWVQWQLPLAIWTIVVLIVGLLIGSLLVLARLVRLRIELHRLRHKLAVTEEEIDRLRILPAKDSL